jgi:hypothetical protein
MGVVDLDQVEVTLLSNGKKRVKRLNGDMCEAQTFSKICRVTLSDGTQYFAELKLVPADFMPDPILAHTVVFDHFFIEGYGVFNDGAGQVVHERRGYI